MEKEGDADSQTNFVLTFTGKRSRGLMARLRGPGGLAREPGGLARGPGGTAKEQGGSSHGLQ